MTIENQIKKVILKYYEQPQEYASFENLILQLHEQLINDQLLIIKKPGVFKTVILGNK